MTCLLGLGDLVKIAKMMVPSFSTFSGSPGIWQGGMNHPASIYKFFLGIVSYFLQNVIVSLFATEPLLGALINFWEFTLKTNGIMVR